MTLDQLQYTLAVAQHRSFVKAAKQLHITQPALTIQIKQLEKETGLVLFDRSRKPITVTEEGERWLKQAREVWRQSQSLRSLASDIRETSGGAVTLGIIPTVAPYLVPLFYDPLVSTYPDLQLTIRELVTEDIIDALKNGTIDAGLLATPTEAAGLELEPLFYEQFFVYVSTNHPLAEQESVAVSELTRHDLWLLQEGNCFRDQVNNLCQLKVNSSHPTHLRYESSSIESLKRIVEACHGITLIPELATLGVAPQQEELIKPLAGTPPVREISLAMHQGVAKKRWLDQIKAVLLENIPSALRQLPAGEVVSPLELTA
ncbi:MAG: LysR substrate-binding domain-containing protein [Cyclobacteriaceae bacterium]